MRCPQCGKVIANDSQFCEYCGARISKQRSKILWIIMFALLGLSALGVGSFYICDLHRRHVKEVSEAKAAQEEAERLAKVEQMRLEEARKRAKLIEEGYVDMGLPSGTLWRSKNEEGGLYNCSNAIAKFGSNLPTREQYEELVALCRWTWLGLDSGYRVTGPNGNNITFPARGTISRGMKYWPRSMGYYWSSNFDPSNGIYYVSYLNFTERWVDVYGHIECRESKDEWEENIPMRCSVRLVRVWRRQE